jgi:trimeric autotransporter adhesin
MYQQMQSPCIPDNHQPLFYYTNKVSTSPVPMNFPATTYQTTTGDTSDFTACYGGDGNDNSSVSQAVSVVVSQSIVATTTTLPASSIRITTGQSVTFTAMVVRQSGDGVPTGSINFFDGTTSLGNSSLNAGGTATLSTTALAAATHSITTSYLGDNESGSSVSNSLTIVVTQSTAKTTLPASANETITFEANAAARQIHWLAPD